MKSREFKKIYHPRTGRYVYKHRGNGIIDNLMKPLKRVASALTGQVLKPFAKKAIQAGVSQAGERVGKKAADKVIERSGELIRKRLSSGSKKATKATKSTKSTKSKPGRAKPRTPLGQDEVNTLIDNLIARS